VPLIPYENKSTGYSGNVATILSHVMTIFADFVSIALLSVPAQTALAE